MTLTRLVASAALLIVTLPIPAHADWVVAPVAGGNTGGDTVKSRPTFGFDADWMGHGIVGFQFDAAWTPKFFNPTNTAADGLISSSSVSTYMLNAILGAPVGGQKGKGVRPYGLAWVGAIHTRVKSDLGLVDVKDTQLGWDGGVGVMGFFTDAVGLMADVRYFGEVKNRLSDATLFPDASRFGFWTISGGIVFRFGGN